MSVSWLEIIQAARARAVPLAAESAGYLVLLLADCVQHAPRKIELSTIELDEEGGVRSLASDPLEPLALERALREVLRELLNVASSAGPSLVRAAGRPAAGNLAAFVAELERALVPVNRTAARRALVRLCRETDRARREGHLSALPAAAPAPAAPAPAAAPPAPAIAQRRSLEPVAAPPLPSAISPEPPPSASPVPPALGDESSTSPETVVALSDSGRPPGRDRVGDRTPHIGTFGSDTVTVPRATAVETTVLSPDLPTAAPPPYASPAPSPRRVGELIASFEVAPGPSDESLRAELKRVAGVEGTPGPNAVRSGAGRTS
jgi:hypothetical protein